MLNKEQIELNKTKFLETNAKYNLFNQELLDFLKNLVLSQKKNRIKVL